jgi:acyl-CoA synthetase (AMP-forming)/AMP-acid ligase II
MALETLNDALRAHAHTRPDDAAVIWLHEDGAREIITYAQLRARAQQFADALRARGFGADDVVILVLKHSPNLVYAFLGAMACGAVPSIFAYLTEKLDPAMYRQRVRALVVEADARAVITFAEFQSDLAALLNGADCRVWSDAELQTIPARSQDECVFDAHKLVFLQYTSGTTGLQKGIAFTHRAVLDHVSARIEAFAMNARDVVVSWLPLYHDMGLISGLVTPLAAGIPTVLMSPFQWVRDPKQLFLALHEFRGTLCWMPNFAFNHCTRLVRDRDLQGINLSHVRAMVNGAEPVRQDTLENFHARFDAYGLAPNAIKSAYGMAELVQSATMCPLHESPRIDFVQRDALLTAQRAVPVTGASDNVLSIVSCGVPLPRTQVRIVDAERRALPERRVGEIILRSSAMLTGYYHRPDLTAQAIHDGWFYSGDLGYLADGQLFVCGRKKDLMISAGKNLYPQDLEAIANSVPGVYAGRAVAFGIVDAELGSERLYLVCELRPEVNPADLRAIEREIRRRVTQTLDVTLAAVQFVEKGWVLKTSNGKLARAANRDKYLQMFGGAQAARNV